MPQGPSLSPAARLLMVAGLLIGGEALGFACPGAAACWPLGSLLLLLTVLMAFGWRSSVVGWAVPLLLGATLALYTSTQPDRPPRSRSRAYMRQTRHGPVSTAHAEPPRWERLEKALSRGLGVGLEWKPHLADLDRAILLGRRDGLSRAQRRVFTDAGTIHVFAISGLHVMVVAWIIDNVLLRLEVPLRVRGLICLPPLWAYVILTGAHPSAVRAALMASFHLLATVLNRRPDMCIAWSLTALVVYTLHPERILDIGCTFSFAVMLGIVLWLDCARRLERFLPIGNKRVRRYVGEFCVTCVAWAAGVPIAAHVFGRFTPGGLLANLFVLSCAKPLVKCGFGALVAGLLCEPLAALLNNAAAGFVQIMVFVSERVASLPFATFKVRPWSYATCAIWYGACLAFLFLIKRIRPGGNAPGRWW